MTTVTTYLNGKLHSIRRHPTNYARAWAEFMRKAGYVVTTEEES